MMGKMKIAKGETRHAMHLASNIKALERLREKLIKSFKKGEDL